MLFLLNWPTFLQLCQVRTASPEANVMEIVRAVLFTGQMPFLLPNQQCRNTNLELW